MGFNDIENIGEFRQTGGVNPLRWDRARELDFISLVEELTGIHCNRHMFISCPFHGRDSHPSFYIYYNDAYCFGCSAAYDCISFTAKHFGYSNKYKALAWLERYYKLPPIGDVTDEDFEPEEVEEVTLVLEDLKHPYIVFASKDVQATQDYVLAEDYLRRYYEGLDAEQVLPLARVLGGEACRTILMAKVNKAKV